MKTLSYMLLMTLFALTLASCATDNAEEGSAAPAASAAPASSTPAANAATAPPAAPTASVAPAPPAAPPKPAAPRTFEVPAGTEISVHLVDSLSSGKNNAGDQFLATLAAPIVVNGQTVVERGAKVQGRVTDAEGAGRVKGRASMRLVLTSIVDGARSFPIVTKAFVAEAEATKGRDAGIIGGAAGVGAAIGAIAGGKKGAGTGAIVGGAAGTGTVLATRGKEVEFGSETRLNFTLTKSAELPAIRTIS